MLLDNGEIICNPADNSPEQLLQRSLNKYDKPRKFLALNLEVKAPELLSRQHFTSVSLYHRFHCVNN